MTDPSGYFWDPDSGFWGAAEYGTFGKAAVVDPVVEGFESGSLNMEKGMTEWGNASKSSTPGLDRTLSVLHIVAGIGDGVGIAADFAPGGKQVNAAAGALAKHADEIGEAASKAAKALSRKADDAAGGASQAQRRLDSVDVDTSKLDRVEPDVDVAKSYREKYAKPKDSGHGNVAGDQEAVLYKRYDKDGNFEKHGVTQDPDTRYSKKEIDGGRLVESERGPRRDMLKKERERVESDPGPLNREPWAGRKKNPNEPD